MAGEHRRKVHLSANDHKRLQELRALKPALQKVEQAPTRGARIADWVAKTVGSWRFIIIQSVILGVWIALNVIAYVQHWDPYPFILLNLVLSFQAAYAAPIIMMSQNRQSEIDRSHAEHDYRINVKASSRSNCCTTKSTPCANAQEILKLTDIIQRLSAHLAPSLSPRSTRRASATNARRRTDGGRRDTAATTWGAPLGLARMAIRASWRTIETNVNPGSRSAIRSRLTPPMAQRRAATGGALPS